MPPETSAPGQRSRSSGIESMKAFAKAACSSMPGRDGEDVRVEDDVLRREPGLAVSRSYARPRISTLRSTVSAWPCSSKAITTTPAP